MRSVKKLETGFLLLVKGWDAIFTAYSRFIGTINILVGTLQKPIGVNNQVQLIVRQGLKPLPQS
jgi:hypothetical protein